jgi:hypothetical protein
MLPNSCNNLTIVYEASVNANCWPVRKWGVSSYFFWGDLELLLPRYVSKVDA